MEQFESNSYKSREARRAAMNEQKNVQKVISGSVKTKKKTGIQKFTDSVFAEDIHKAGDYVKQEVLLPSLKKAISDIIKNGIDILLYGETRSSRNSSAPAAKISYQKYYDNPSSGLKPHVARSTYSYDDLLFDNRGEAQLVLDGMDEILNKYGIVSVADLYDLVGMTGNYTDNSYGWTDLHSASVIRTQDGYLLKLPRVSPINQR